MNLKENDNLPNSEVFVLEEGEPVKKNIEEGRGIGGMGGILGKGDGSFQFATSNEMWRASLEILDFVPLINADYGGGIIITDWYKNKKEKNESLKITVHFLSNEIRADGLKVTVYNKSCILDSGIQNCSTQIDDTSEIGQELKLAILKKAAILEKQNLKKTIKRIREEEYTEDRLSLIHI